MIYVEDCPSCGIVNAVMLTVPFWLVVVIATVVVLA